MSEYLMYSIESIFGVCMFVNATLFIPQAVKTYKTKNVEGLSAITFFGFNVIQLFTFLHGYIHQDYILMLGMALSLIFCGTITFLSILYRS